MKGGGWYLLLILIPLVSGRAIVCNESITIVEWEAHFLTQHNLSLPFPLSTMLYPSSLLNSSLLSQLSGVVLYQGEPRSSNVITKDFAEHLQLYQQFPGIQGVLVVDSKLSPGFFSGFLGVGLKIPDTNTVPVWIVGRDFTNRIKGCPIGTQGLHLELVDFEFNDWNTYNGAYRFWVASLIIGNIISILMAMVTLIYFWKNGKWLNLATICIMIEGVGTVCRILGLIFVWGNVGNSFLDYKFFLTLSFPFLLSASGLLVFFWLDLTSGSLYSGKFLDRMKRPAIAFIVLLIVNEITLDIVRFFFDIPLKNAIYIIYIIICVFLGVLYLIVAHKISKIIKKNSKGEFLKRVNFKARICGLIFFIGGFAALLMVVPGATESYVGVLILWYILYMCLILLSILQISVFFPSAQIISSSFSSRTKTKSKSGVQIVSKE